MKKATLISVLAVSATLLSFKIVSTDWTIDKTHAKLGFSITHLMVSDVEGSFKITESTISGPNAEDFNDAVVTLTADVNTVDTDNEQRDEHLKKPDFFDATKYPTITFKSFSFRKVKDKTYAVKGNLTMHGVTKPVELEAIANTGVHPYTKKSIAGFKISGKIKRTDFGIAATMGESMLSDEVLVHANAEFEKK